MAIEELQEKYIPRDNMFYRSHYHQIIWVVMGILALLMIATGGLIYEVFTRPIPLFGAVQPNGQSLELTAYDNPNTSPQTILRWASKAATVAYTFNWANYNAQISAARTYFTADGWQGYLQSAQSAINTIVKGQLAANGVVSGTPVISNQGNILPNDKKTYAWRVQIPFVVTYQSSNQIFNDYFFVVLTIVKVPTYINKQGIGIDQFIMIRR